RRDDYDDRRLLHPVQCDPADRRRRFAEFSQPDAGDALGYRRRDIAIGGGAARIMGIDVDRIVITAFFLGSALAGAAALIFGLYYNFTSFIIGYTAGLRAFTAAVLGGIGSITAALGRRILFR